MFISYNKGGNFSYFISLETGSKSVETDKNLFMLSGYDGKQRFSYQFYTSEPTYDQVKELAVKIMTTEDPEKIIIATSPFEVDLNAWATGNAKKVNASLHKKSDHYLFAHRELPK